MADLRTKIAEAISGLNISNLDKTLKTLSEEAQMHAFNEELLQERMAELEAQVVYPGKQSEPLYPA